MKPQRLAVKLHARGPVGAEARDLVPILHRWIQTDRLEELLIDVVDYAHVHQGPGVILIGDAGDYGVDLERGRLGLKRTRKRHLEGELGARLRTTLREVLAACRLLEQEVALAGKLRFEAGDLRVELLDRLEAPDTPAALGLVEPELRALLAGVYGSVPFQLERDVTEGGPLALSARTTQPVDVAAALARLA